MFSPRNKTRTRRTSRYAGAMREVGRIGTRGRADAAAHKRGKVHDSHVRVALSSAAFDAAPPNDENGTVRGSTTNTRKRETRTWNGFSVNPGTGRESHFFAPTVRPRELSRVGSGAAAWMLRAAFCLDDFPFFFLALGLPSLASSRMVRFLVEEDPGVGARAVSPSPSTLHLSSIGSSTPMSMSLAPKSVGCLLGRVFHMREL